MEHGCWFCESHCCPGQQEDVAVATGISRACCYMSICVGNRLKGFYRVAMAMAAVESDSLSPPKAECGMTRKDAPQLAPSTLILAVSLHSYSDGGK